MKEATKALQVKVKLIEKKIKILQTFDLSHVNGRRYFGDDGSQNCLIFQRKEGSLQMY